MCAFKHTIKTIEANVDVQKGVLGFRENYDNKYASLSNSHFHSLLSLSDNRAPNDYLVHSCWGLHLGHRFSKIEGSWSVHGLP